MRWPVNEWNKWYIALGFGEKTNYGYHDGCDINLRTGGDTDLGEYLLAISNGQITSVHEHTTIPTFGKHLHLKFESPFGTRWVHYAHCQEIMVKEGDLVSEGQLIAKLGKSGTTIAHCHFAIKKEPTGIDGIAKTLDDLQKWENPIVFIEKCIAKLSNKYSIFFQGNEVGNCETNPMDKIKDLENQVRNLNEEVATARLEINSLRDALTDQEKDNTDLANQLGEARSERDKAVGNEKTALAKVSILEETISNQKKALDKSSQKISDLEHKLAIIQNKELGDYSFKELLIALIKKITGKKVREDD